MALAAETASEIMKNHEDEQAQVVPRRVERPKRVFRERNPTRHDPYPKTQTRSQMPVRLHRSPVPSWWRVSPILVVEEVVDIFDP